MKSVTAIKRAGEWNPGAASDSVVLDAQDRLRRRIVFIGQQGACYLLNLQWPAQLHDGDCLVLESGEQVRVVGKPEPLVEVSADDTQALAKLAWHLGNRHTEVQFAEGRLRIRKDHVIEEMLLGLGATLTRIEAPFDPEPGAHVHGQDHGS
jgi:urease accessory protein